MKLTKKNIGECPCPVCNQKLEVRRIQCNECDFSFGNDCAENQLIERFNEIYDYKSKASVKTALPLIGPGVAYNATSIENCVLLGFNTGRKLTDECGVIIIGDYIEDLDRSQKDVMFVGDKMAIGRTLFGAPINLRQVIEAYLKL